MANDFYSATGFPSYKAWNASSGYRGEYTLIEDGFDKVSPLTGHGGEIVVVNGGETAQESVAISSVSSLIGAQEVSEKDVSGGYVGRTLYSVNLVNVAGTFTSLLTNSNTAARTYTLQDADGTIEHTGHSIASHGDTTATGAELETLTSGASADSLHSHTTGNLSDTTATGANLTALTDGSSASALHTHTVANLSDTTATAANLDSLTDGSNADALHTHLISGMTVISTDTTFYFDPAGGGEGDGSVGAPWFDPSSAFLYLADKWINNDITVTLSMAAGTFDGSNLWNIKHPCAGRIKIVGAGVGVTNGADGTNVIFTYGSTGGVVVDGVNFGGISDLTLTGKYNDQKIGVEVKNGGYCPLTNVGLSTWGYCVQSSASNADLLAVSMLNCSYGLMAIRSTVTINGYSTIAASLSGVLAYEGSFVNADTTTVTESVSVGFAAGTNSFISAIYTSAPSYYPSVTTGNIPSFGNIGSWIYKP